MGEEPRGNVTSFPVLQFEPDEGRVLLKDGRTARIRRADESDRGRVVQLLRSVSDRSRFQRFFGGGRNVDTMADNLLQVGNPRERLTLIVLHGPPGDPEIIGLGSYVRQEDDPGTAEPAFLVRDDQQGRGIGTLLLERLALMAVRQGIQRFEAYTLPDNDRMRSVFRDSGFPVETAPGGDSFRVRFPLDPNESMVLKSEMRDQVATVASLRPMFEPRGVAVIGASRDPESIGHRVLVSLVDAGFHGSVYAVNPAADAVASCPAYDSVLEVEDPVDLAVVAVPPPAVESVVEECHEAGVRSLIVLTAGYSETGPEGAARQRSLRDRIFGHGMRMVGPNCLGLINTDPDVRLNASFAPFFPRSGNLAMASQSGALGVAVLDYATSRGMGFSSFVSVGNKADVSGNDLLQYWEEDGNTEVILLYLESFGNPRRFARLARRVGLKKPIVVVKGGRTEAGRRAASSHTAALASSSVAVEALFEQTGIIPADSLEGMFHVARLLSSQPLPEGPRVAIVTNSGGPGILTTDACEAAGLELAEFGPPVRETLDDLLADAASLDNPVDMVAAAGPKEYRGVLEAVLRDGNVDAVVVIYTPLALAGPEDIARAVEEGVEAGWTAADRKKPVAGVFIEPEDERTELSTGDGRIPTYRFPEDAARALGHARRYGTWRRNYREDPPRMPRPDRFDPDQARTICRTRAEETPGWLGLEDTRALLEAVGVPMAEAHLTGSPDEAVEAARSLGYPVVVKMSSTTLVHKTEWEGIELDVETDEEVRAAYGAVTGRLEEAGRMDELEGIAVQKQIDRGTELMVGMTEDETFGPLVTFGLGGIYVEILEDVAVRIAPLTDQDVEAMLNGIRGRDLLDGYRGHPPADREALKDFLLRVSRLVENVPEIVEIDMNPLKALPPGEGYRVLDARVRVAPAGRASRG